MTARAKDGKAVDASRATSVLVAVGRRPYTAGLGLDEAGVKYDAKSGRIAVDEQFQTNVPGVYAIGDLIDGPMLAHKASEEGVVVRRDAGGTSRTSNYDAIPSVIYIWPEVASVGQTEEQVKETGRRVPGRQVPVRRQRPGEGDGRDGRLGEGARRREDRPRARRPHPRPAGVGPDRRGVTVMEYHGSAEDIARCIHAHPTLTEAVGEAARAAWLGMALHA